MGVDLIKILRNNGGFTLLEVLIAMTILAIGLLGVAGLTLSVMRGNIFSDKITTATTLAQDKMEDIKRLGFAGTPATDTTTTEDYNTITNYLSYKRVTFTDVDNPSPDMKTVTVTAYWNPGNHSVALNTILSE